MLQSFFCFLCNHFFLVFFSIFPFDFFSCPFYFRFNSFFAFFLLSSMFVKLVFNVILNEIIHFQALAGYLQLSDLDWKYQTSPPPDRAYCQAMNGDRCNWPRGKVMGGSSVSYHSNFFSFLNSKFHRKRKL